MPHADPFPGIPGIPGLAEPPVVLEPAARRFVERHHCPAVPPGADPDAARAALAPLLDRGGHDADIGETWLTVPAPGPGPLRVRLLRPADGGGPLPVVLFLHGLGWLLSDADAHWGLLRDLVLGADAAVLVPDYDRPPAARHPVALRQCRALLRWLARDGARHGLDGARVAVVGVSAGANLAAALTLLAHRHGDPRPVHQVLVCPVTDAALATPSAHRFADGHFLGRDAMRTFWDQYVPDPARRADPTAAPLRAAPADLAGLPPALVLTAEADVLRDEGEAYAALLRAAGVPVVSARYHGTVHGFVLFDALRRSPAARAARAQITDTLSTALHTPA
ncbi:alpha/beta hydrolase [Streptomyces sp. NPDC048290]|uniref:alpha/beta hydrolase n=1 Tax=Streptomyces sp. NPDC048290 TaxID=3155811 RepID=UPI00341346B7